jgi:hypothetical protein
MEMPTEAEMLAKDKYTVFDRKVKRYRKGIHSTCGLVNWWMHGKLMWSRGAEVDEGQPETQSPGFLDGYGDECVRMKCILFCHHTLCNGYDASWTNNLYIKDTRPKVHQVSFVHNNTFRVALLRNTAIHFVKFSPANRSNHMSCVGND